MKKTLTLKKLVISKLNNPSNIVGGETLTCHESNDCHESDGGGACDPISTKPLGCPLSISAIFKCHGIESGNGC